MDFQYSKITSDCEQIRVRAGNAKSIDFPCKVEPKSIQVLRNASPNSGHDLHLNGEFYLLDLVISKPLRTLLLIQYGKYINVVSSSSLMHRPDMVDVDVDEVPSIFRYGISVAVNLRLIKKMCAELCSVRLRSSEIDELVELFEQILTDEKISLPPVICNSDIERILDDNLIVDNGRKMTCSVYRRHYGSDLYSVEIKNINLIVLEQLARYTSSVLYYNKGKTFQTLFNCEKIGDKIHEVDFIATKEQLDIIFEQRKNHKRPEWKIICDRI